MRLTKANAFEILELKIGTRHHQIVEQFKKLALQWYPEKHRNSTESIRKFYMVNAAYARLTDEQYDSDEDIELSMPEMVSQFKEALVNNQMNGYESSDYDDDDDDDEDFDDDDDDDEYDTHHGHILGALGTNFQRRNSGTTHVPRLTAEEIEKNAHELIDAEQKDKAKDRQKAEKRRLKKKRRRERKKLEKLENSQKKNGITPNPPSKLKEENEDRLNQDSEKSKARKDKKSKESTSEVEDFDPNAAFFTKVVNKKKKSGQIPEQPAVSKVKSKAIKAEEDPDDIDSVVLRSRQLAIRGNEMAQLGHYSAAIDLFTEAIKLDSRDFRFFGNRSYCYDRMQQYERALRDAEKAISLAPDWPKGYFRKGRALAGLKLNADAEAAFMQVLKLDRNCEDAMQELLRVRTYQLTEMGFSRPQAEAAIRQHNNVQQALDSLLAGVVAENTLTTEVHQSEEEESHHTAVLPQAIAIPPRGDSKMDPTNPEGLTALWVGNVLPEVTDKRLTQMFSKYGVVTSVRCLPEKYCAFINFKSKEAAGKAMQNLQGVECAGQRLLIKFPDNPITNNNTASANVVVRKPQQKGATAVNAKRRNGGAQPRRLKKY